MALKAVRAWTGQRRRLLQDVLSDLASILNFDAKHPAEDYLTPTDHTTIATLQLSFAAKLTATRLR